MLLSTNPQSLASDYKEFYTRVMCLRADAVYISTAWFSVSEPVDL